MLGTKKPRSGFPAEAQWFGGRFPSGSRGRCRSVARAVVVWTGAIIVRARAIIVGARAIIVGARTVVVRARAVVVGTSNSGTCNGAKGKRHPSVSWTPPIAPTTAPLHFSCRASLNRGRICGGNGRHGDHGVRCLGASDRGK